MPLRSPSPSTRDAPNEIFQQAVAGRAAWSSLSPPLSSVTLTLPATRSWYNVGAAFGSLSPSSARDSEAGAFGSNTECVLNASALLLQDLREEEDELKRCSRAAVSGTDCVLNSSALLLQDLKEEDEQKRCPRAAVSGVSNRLIMSRRKFWQCMVRGTGNTSASTSRTTLYWTSLAICALDDWRGRINDCRCVRQRTQDHCRRLCEKSMSAWNNWKCMKKLQKQQVLEQLAHKEKVLAFVSKLVLRFSRAAQLRKMYIAWCRHVEWCANGTQHSNVLIRTRMSLLGRYTVLALRSFASHWLGSGGVHLQKLTDSALQAQRLAILRRILASWESVTKTAHLHYLSKTEDYLLGDSLLSCSQILRQVEMSVSSALLAQQAVISASGLGKTGRVWGENGAVVQEKQELHKIEFSSRKGTLGRQRGMVEKDVYESQDEAVAEASCATEFDLSKYASLLYNCL